MQLEYNDTIVFRKTIHQIRTFYKWKFKNIIGFSM